MARPRPHGELLAADVGELAGVSGTTIGQWARRGYIRSSQSDGDPRVYSVEDAAEAVMVAILLERGLRHADVRRAIEALRGYGAWPLSAVPLATVAGTRRVVVRDRDAAYDVGAGWQLVAVPVVDLEDVRLRLGRRARGD